jgi:hypothetical protein
VKTQVQTSEWTVVASRCRILLRDTILEASVCVCMRVIDGWLGCSHYLGGGLLLLRFRNSHDSSATPPHFGRRLSVLGG